jgi:hypothetical protein
MTELLVFHLMLTWAMVGFAWTIQLLQYPGMADVPASSFPAYERNHQRRVSVVLLLFAPAEVLTAAWIVLREPDDPIAWVAGALLAAIWISTGAWFAPVHARLAEGFDATLHRKLVTTNWFRTAAWTTRGFLVMGLVL